jgi:hypothetical protein
MALDQATIVRIIGAKWESFVVHLPSGGDSKTSSMAVVQEFNTLLNATRSQLPDLVPFLPKDIDLKSPFRDMGVCVIGSSELRVMAQQVVAAIKAIHQ